MASRSLGVLTLDLIARIGGFESGMDKAARHADRRMKEIQGSVKKLGAVLGAVLGTGSIAVALSNAVNRMDELKDASIRLGIGIETLSAYDFAARQTGTSIESLGTGFKTLSKSMAEALNPDSGKARVFEALGIQVKDATGNLRQFEEIIPEIANQFRLLEDGTTKAALAQELFGKSGLELIEFLNQGGDGITKLTDRARELGLVIDQETADKADQFKDSLDELKGAAEGLASQVAAELLPNLIALVDWAKAFVVDGGNAKNIADDIAGAFDVLGDAASIVWKSLETVGATTRGVTSSFLALYNSARAVQAIQGFKFGDAQEFIRNAEVAREMAAEQGQAIKEIWSGAKDARDKALAPVRGDPLNGMFSIPGVTGNQFSAVPTVFPQGGGLNRDALNKALAGIKPDNPAKAKKEGKSDAEKEAEQLKAAYDRMNGSLAEQIALFGKTGEEAKVRYEIEHGELQKLTAVQKEGLIVQAQKIDQLRDEKDVQEELDRLNKQRTEAVEQVLSDIQAQRDLIDQTSEYQDTYNKLKYAGVDANSAFGQSIIAANQELWAESEAMADRIEAMDAVRDGIKDIASTIADGTASWKSFGDAIDDVAKKLLNIIVNNLVEKAFGQQGTSGSGSSAGGWLAKAFGALFGGGSGASGVVGPRAAGGAVSPFSAYRVNEIGPEMASIGGRDYLLMGSQFGRVHSAQETGKRMGRSASVTQNIMVQGRPTRSTSKQIARDALVAQQRELSRTG